MSFFTSTLFFLVCFTTSNGDLEEYDVLNILTYNIFMRPPTRVPLTITSSAKINRDAQVDRANLLPTELGKLDVDVIVFQEAFYDEVNDILDDEMCDTAGFCYSTSVFDDPAIDVFSLQVAGVPFIYSTGVRIFSKYEIIDGNQHDIFDSASGVDESLANKGVVYVKIKKGLRDYNIFGTHLQSGRSDEKTAVKQDQIQQINTFISSFNLPSSEPVIILGDWNIDETRDADDGTYVFLTNELDCTELTKDLVNGLPDTTSTDIDLRYVNDPDHGNSNWLDQIHYKNLFLNPINSLSYEKSIKISSNYEIKSIEKEKERSILGVAGRIRVPTYGDDVDVTDLSDHHGVYGRLVFPKSE